VAGEFTYDYAIIRAVPRVERGERINVGVIVSCVDGDFLDGRFEVDEARLQALDATIDLDAVRAAIASMTAVCAGGAAAGPLGALPARERFRWLVSPRSTIIQPSRVHTGRARDPVAALDHLFATVVRPNRAPERESLPG
jgi:hypothetical protein